MQGIYRAILKHAGIYGVGQILGRLGSFLLLPLYTAYLSPADYGCIAILDLTVGVLSLLIGRGISAAVNRYHFEANTEPERDQVWWTGLTFLVCTATVCILPLYLGRQLLASITLGPTLSQGSAYYGFVLLTLWCNVVAELPYLELRSRHRSTLYVSLSLSSLIINMGLNIFFLTVTEMGVTGVLLGNLLTGVLRLLIAMSIFTKMRGRYTLHLPLIRQLWQFGSPLIVTGLLAMVMHQADRYMLLYFFDLDQVGLYSLAYTLGQAVNTLYLSPFDELWAVAIYDVAKFTDAKHIHAKVFEYFAYGLFLLMFAVSLAAQPLLQLMAAPSYGAAASLVPIVCLAYIFFSMHAHFRSPALLAKQTTALLPAALCGALSNIVGNFLLIPWLGVTGAAWASVLTFITFSFVGLWRYRQIDYYAYPLVRCGIILAALIVSYGACQGLRTLPLPTSWIVGITVMVWCTWAIVLLGPAIRRLFNSSPDDSLAKIIPTSTLAQS